MGEPRFPVRQSEYKMPPFTMEKDSIGIVPGLQEL